MHRRVESPPTNSVDDPENSSQLPESFIFYDPNDAQLPYHARHRLERIKASPSSPSRRSEDSPKPPSPTPISLDKSMVITTSKNPPPPPKTRKRISPAQLEKLEKSFHKDTHPPREVRQMLASKLDMELKSVTIWFQNKRQTAKKDELAANSHHSPKKFKLSHSYSAASASSSSSSLIPYPRRPTLESVASLSELPPPRPRALNHPYHPDHQPHIWGHMVSSPSASPSPPPSPTSSLAPTEIDADEHRHHPFISNTTSLPSFGTTTNRQMRPSRSSSFPSPTLSNASLASNQSRRSQGRVTLAWACANAALDSPRPKPKRRLMPDEVDIDQGEKTDEGDQEAITPSEGRSLASLGRSDSSSTSYRLTRPQLESMDRTDKALEQMGIRGRTVRNAAPVTFDAQLASGAGNVDVLVVDSRPRSAEEEMDAALALCGLLGS